MRLESMQTVYASSTPDFSDMMRVWDYVRASQTVFSHSDASDVVPFRVIQSSSLTEIEIGPGLLQNAILEANRDIDSLVAHAQDETDLAEALLERIRQNQRTVESWLGLNRQLEIRL